MMSSNSPREEQSSSKARKSFKTINKETMVSLRADGLSSGFEHQGRIHSGTDFTPIPRQEKSMKVISDSPLRPLSDGTRGTTSTFNRLMMSMETQKGGSSSSTMLQTQLTPSPLALIQ